MKTPLKLGTQGSDKPILHSLLKTLQAAGFYVSTVDNGDGPVKVRTLGAALEEILAVDDSVVTFAHAGESRTFWLRVVRGNAPDETVNDFVCRNTPTGLKFTHTIETWSDAQAPHDA